jgi:hypothetical protein
MPRVNSIWLVFVSTNTNDLWCVLVSMAVLFIRSEEQARYFIS